jgi:hypothetical protein
MTSSLWEAERITVFRERLARFAEQLETFSVSISYEIRPADALVFLLLHGATEYKWLREERAVLHGMAVGLGLPSDELDREIMNHGLKPLVILFEEN